jgi:hypothetical protein
LKKLKQKIAGRYKPKRHRKRYFDSRIKVLEKEIEEKTSALKKALPYKSSVIPKLKTEVEQLKRHAERERSEEKRRREILKRIEPSVDVVSDELFDMSLNEIKAELSDRIKNKEATIQQELNDDLKLREEAFKKKYSDIEQAYHKMYEDKIKNQLKTEVRKRFNKLLKQRLEAKKAELTGKELQELKERAEREFNINKQELREMLSHRLKEAKEGMRKHFEEELMLHKHKLHQKFEQDIAEEVKKLKAQLRIEKGREVGEALRRKSEQLKKSLRKEFEGMLAKEIRRKEAELAKKRYAFESEVRKEAKTLFGTRLSSPKKPSLWKASRLRYSLP